LITLDGGFCEMATGKAAKTNTIFLPGVAKINRANGIAMAARGSELAISTRATLTGTGLTSIHQVPTLVEQPAQQAVVGDLFDEVPTKSTSLSYLQENPGTDSTDVVLEEGEIEESSWSLEEKETATKRVSSISRCTEEILKDFAGAQAWFNSRLGSQIAQREDREILNGSGSGAHILGILNTPLIQTQAQGANTAPDAIFKAMTKVRTIALCEPTAIVMHPNDWEGIRLMKDANGAYYGGGIFEGSYGQRFTSNCWLWGLPVILTTFIQQGFALVGAFKIGATIYRRLGLAIDITNSDGDDFKRGRIAIRPETRFALAVTRPVAFCEVTGLN
jgi:HK97 family phage major capsid protein